MKQIFLSAAALLVTLTTFAQTDTVKKQTSTDTANARNRQKTPDFLKVSLKEVFITSASPQQDSGRAKTSGNKPQKTVLKSIPAKKN